MILRVGGCRIGRAYCAWLSSVSSETLAVDNLETICVYTCPPFLTSIIAIAM